MSDKQKIAVICIGIVGLSLVSCNKVNNTSVEPQKIVEETIEVQESNTEYTEVQETVEESIEVIETVEESTDITSDLIEFELEDDTKYTANITVEDNHKVANVISAEDNYEGVHYIKHEDLDESKYDLFKFNEFPEDVEEYFVGKLMSYEDMLAYIEKFGVDTKFTDTESNYCVLSYDSDKPVLFELYDYGIYHNSDYDYDALRLYYYESWEDATDKDTSKFLLIFPTDADLDMYIELEDCFKSVDQMLEILPDVFYRSKIEPSFDKPVIYLYPEEETGAHITDWKKPVMYLYDDADGTDVEVSLKLHDADFTCVYPSFNNSENSWKVKAFPNGDIKVGDKTYNYLYWEAQSHKLSTFKPQYCIKGEDTAKFLEEKLLELGLTEHEANEFIVYWLPQMEDNKYNLISFDNEEYCKNAELNVSPAPNTVIRVYMQWKSSEQAKGVVEPKIVTPERKGFTVVEWGGSEVQ